jgi:hypothetical protein
VISYRTRHRAMLRAERVAAERERARIEVQRLEAIVAGELSVPFMTPELAAYRLANCPPYGPPDAPPGRIRRAPPFWVRLLALRVSGRRRFRLAVLAVARRGRHVVAERAPFWAEGWVLACAGSGSGQGATRALFARRSETWAGWPGIGSVVVVPP